MPKGKTSKNKQTSSDPYPATKKNIDKTDTNVEDATVETDTVHYCNKSTRLKQGTKCSVCCRQIVDKSNNQDGEDAIFCEGRCGWIHRQCAGLSDPFFRAFTGNDTPFLCVFCMLKTQSEEITNLKATIDDLKNSIAKLTSKSQGSKIQIAPKNATTSTASAYQTIATNVTPTKTQARRSTDESLSSSGDRRFNLIVYGIAESPSNTPRLDRLKRDLDHLIKVFQSISVPIEAHAVKDFHRLGKYKPTQSRPRPILVKFLRTIDVTTILSNRASLDTSISIKQDLSPEEKHLESILLNERWKLIQAGYDRKSIKIRRGSILLNGKLFGHLDGSNFKKASPPITATETEVILLQSTAHVTPPTIEGVSTSTEMETSADQVSSLPTPPPQSS